MKTRCIAEGSFIVALCLMAGSAFAQIRVIDNLNNPVAARLASQLRAVDFERLPVYSPGPGQPEGLPSPLTLDGITFSDPTRFLRTSFCSFPDCEHDPNNHLTGGGNILLALRVEGSISFTQKLEVVVLDIQGIGNEAFTLLVTDGASHQETVSGRGDLRGAAFIVLLSPAGISTIEIQSARNAITLAQVLYAEKLPNQCPEPAPRSIEVVKVSSMNFTLITPDADNDPTFYVVTRTPAHGILMRLPPSMTYIPNPGYAGTDTLTYQVTDGLCEPFESTVTFNVIPNSCPTAQIGISPNLVLSPYQTEVIAIANCDGKVCLRLDGTMSLDPDGDHLTYRWVVDGVPLGSSDGVVATNCVETGFHKITLEVDDGLCTASASVEIEVITAREAVEGLIERIQDSKLPRRHQRPLIVTLNASAASFGRGNFNAGRWQLSAFIHQVRAQVSKTNRELSKELVQIAQTILQQADCEKKCRQGKRIPRTTGPGSTYPGTRSIDNSENVVRAAVLQRTPIITQ